MAYGKVSFLSLQAAFALFHTMEKIMTHFWINCAQVPSIPLRYTTSRKKSIRQINCKRPMVAPIATAIVKKFTLLLSSK